MGNNINNYQKVLEPFTENELKQIAQVKRFFECYEGDTDFREAVNAGTFSEEQLNRMKQIGLQFDFSEMAIMWENPEAIQDFVLEICGNKNPAASVDASTEALLKKYPLMKLWLKFIMRKNMQFKEICGKPFSVDDSRFDHWRSRRIASAESELGAYNHYIDHPTLAIELSEGCSVQCWFCAFSSNRLKKVLDYNENRNLFRGVVQACTDLFGSQAAGIALLYYATEPYDNPHYVDYMKDFADITGSTVCTSTAVGTDKNWMDQLITYYREHTLPWPRLSVLSTKMMHKIHDNHTPYELRDVTLLMQMKESERQKVSGGRIFSENGDMRHRNTTNYMQDIIPQGTIACVTGFYINMVRKDIQLVSPCYTSEKWPYGYRVYDEASFDTIEDFRSTLLEMIERNMPEAPPAQMLLRLRDDLEYRPTENGFDLVSPNQIHHFHDKSVFNALGDLLMKPPVTYEEAGDILVDQYKQDIFAVHAVLKYLFDNGFLDEVRLPFKP